MCVRVCVCVVCLLSLSRGRISGCVASRCVGELQRCEALPRHARPDPSTRPLLPTPAHCPCPLQEIRRVWLGMLSQCDQSLGQKVAAKLQAASAL